MLLNEFLKQHRTAQVEERKVAELEATVEKQQKLIEALRGGLRKVSDQLDLIKVGPQVIARIP